jgi:hypothetical protein
MGRQVSLANLKKGRRARNAAAALIGGILHLVSLSAPAQCGKIVPLHSDDTNEIAFAFVGPIIRGDAASLRRKLEYGYNARKTVIIYFHSEGGLASEAVAVGRVIKDFSGTTYVLPGGYCKSACFLAWGGGAPNILDGQARRIFTRGTQLEIHTIQLVITEGICTREEQERIFWSAAETSAEITAYLVEMGFKDSVIRRIVSRAGKDLPPLTTAEYEENKIGSSSINDNLARRIWDNLAGSGVIDGFK